MKETKNSNSFNLDLVSIIVPVYNGEKYLSRCIKSVKNQKYKNIEMILVNDGSTDKSGKICDEFSSQDHRIKVIHSTNNGPAAARNIGIKNSHGEFIFFVDSDDFIKKNAINLLVEYYKEYKSDVIIGDFVIKNDKTNSSNKRYLFKNNKFLKKPDIINFVKNYLKKPTGYSLFIYVWGKLFRSSIIKKNNIYFNTNLQVYEDISFNFEYLKFCNSVYYGKDHIYTYVLSNGHDSAGKRIVDNPVGFKSALKTIGEFLKDNKVDDQVIMNAIGNATIAFTIRSMIRIFAISENFNPRYLHKLIFTMINDPEIRKNLQFYLPSKGDSKILPALIKLKLVWLIMLVCRYKVYKR